MLIITTMDKMPKGCYDNCICNHDGWCHAIHTNDGSEFDHQEAQPVRPYNCPLKIEKEEVVHCRDCKYNSLPETSGNALCEKLYGMTDPDGYCSLAERKDSYSDK